MPKTAKFLRDVLDLFIPDVCPGCRASFLSGQKVMCLSCRVDLPLCQFAPWPENPLEIMLEGRLDLVAACALLYFEKKGLTQNLVHALKYRDRQDLGLFFGSLLVKEMLESHRFDGVDCVVAVPLHPAKFKKRGYNQTWTFAERLSRDLGVPFYQDALKRRGPLTTQTVMDRSQRSELLHSCFFLHRVDGLTGRHMLLVDDVVTTGATLESCAKALRSIPGMRLSVAAMAFAK